MKRIEINQRVCNGQPVISGTRIPVTVILDQVADDKSWDWIIKNYPGLTREDIATAVHYASQDIDHSNIELLNV